METEFGNEYKLVRRRKDTQVAEVRNYAKDASSYRRIKIVQDDEKMDEVRMRLISSTWRNGEPYIVVTSKFLELPQTHQVAAIWHEVGHVHHEHHLFFISLGLQNQKELRQRRLAYTRRDEVVPEETEADLFAIERVGRLPFVEFLKHLMDTRPAGVSGGLNDLGGRELALRIARIQNGAS